MEYINWTLATGLFWLVLGYYLGERGWTGVKVDLNNVKLDVEKIKGKLDPATVVVSTPVTPATTAVVSAQTAALPA